MPKVLQELLSHSADHYPRRPAVQFANREITYGELVEISDGLAGALAARGIGPGDRVGIQLPKSVEMIASVFGVLKAGAAYVPLDHGSPGARNRRIAKDCEIGALITDAAGLATLGSRSESSPIAPTVVLTGPRNPADETGSGLLPWSVWREFSDSPPQLEQTPEDLAYILYTSGSTGQPKGVMITHRASLAFVEWAAEFFALGPQDRVSNHAPLHFDLSVFDIFATIKSGGCILPVPPEISIFPLELVGFLETQRITVWYSVPSVLCRLVVYGALEGHPCRQLEKILFAGEVFPIKHLLELQRRLPRARYYNLYGPTETNVCTCSEVPRLAADDVGPLPIGKPCSGDEVWIESEGQPAGPGQRGEILVSGATLMSGYWGRPDLTAEVLVDRDLTGGKKRRAYRTGDRGMLAETGEFLFLGRLDDMIKSRGFRIEPGEIEAVLQSHPAVEEASVLPLKDELSGGSLAAFVVARPGNSPGAARLRRFCAANLPKYMVPTRFEFLDALPRTRTGKVDRNDLQRRLQSR